MDLIQTLSTSLGLPADQAQALAGGLLSTVQANVAAPDVDADASALDAQVPELADWKAKAQAMAAEPASGGGGLFGQMAGLAGSGLGNQLLGAVAGKEAQEKAMFVSLLTKLGLQPQHAAMAAGPVLAFLKERMPPAWVAQATAAMPLLQKLDADGDGLEVSDLTSLSSLLG